MPSLDTFMLFRHAIELTELVRSHGISLEYGENFNAFSTATRRQPNRQHINPAFDPERCELPTDCGFWVIGHDELGEIVHTQAIRLLDFEGGNLEQHFQRRLWDYRTHGVDFDPHRCHFFLSPDARNIAGIVTYHGELWLKGGVGGYRDGTLVTILTRLMLLKAFLRYSPDFMIGLQSPVMSFRGLGIREGYMRTEQRTIVWALRGSSDFQEDWLVWMNKEEAEFNLRVPASSLLKHFGGQKLDAARADSA
ncbi:MAG: hypothetical protein ACRBM6_09790 [Geminicoccales bacterium]